jgi:transposase
MPRRNASVKAMGRQAWREMMEFREKHPRRFEKRYHKRSNAESTNMSFKSKYGEFLRSRVWHTQKREAGLKVLTYNIRQLIRFRIRVQLEIRD